jgi:hypothetical protein
MIFNPQKSERPKADTLGHVSHLTIGSPTALLPESAQRPRRTLTWRRYTFFLP